MIKLYEKFIRDELMKYENYALIKLYVYGFRLVYKQFIFLFFSDLSCFNKLILIGL